MKRDIPIGAGKGSGEVFGQHVFAGGLGADQQQIFAAKKRRHGGFPDFPAVVEEPRVRNAVVQAGIDVILRAEQRDFRDQVLADAFFS